MGVTVGATLRAGGHEVLWASAGRSPETRARADAASLQAADRLGVRDALDAQREAMEAGSAAGLEARAYGSAAKAWRFVGEMREIADTFASVDLPSGFHLAAAEVYQAMAASKED